MGSSSVLRVCFPVLIALFIRLPDPTWALITAFVVMLAQFVGAVAEKSMMRVIGTVVGGVIGYLLTAGLEQQPVLYLLLVGGVVGFGTAMFGYAKYPYAFLLCALTTMVVASNGMNDPAFSWRPALARIEEVCVGVITAVLVTSLVWPRYARKEFLEKMRLALAELRKGLVARSALLFEAPAEADGPGRPEFRDGYSGVAEPAAFRSNGKPVFPREASDIYRDDFLPQPNFCGGGYSCSDSSRTGTFPSSPPRRA